MDHRLITLPASQRPIVIGAILLIWLIVRASQFWMMRGKQNQPTPPGAERTYGLAGGTICPKCGRPFALSPLAIKIGLGLKLARCEHCRAWSAVRRRSLAELRAAEAAEQAGDQAAATITEQDAEQKLRQQVEKSRYTDQL